MLEVQNEWYNWASPFLRNYNQGEKKDKREKKKRFMTSYRVNPITHWIGILLHLLENNPLQLLILLSTLIGFSYIFYYSTVALFCVVLGCILYKHSLPLGFDIKDNSSHPTLPYDKQRSNSGSIRKKEISQNDCDHYPFTRKKQKKENM